MDTPITRTAELAGKDGQVVRVAGIYSIQDLGRYKLISTLADGSELQTNKLSYLKLDDGESVRLGGRPESEHVLAGRRVIATGMLREFWPPRQPAHVAQPDAKPTLVQITSVEVISG